MKIIKVIICIVSITSVFVILNGCSNEINYKEILAFPVYGQSLALAEAAERVSSNEELASYNGRILTENLDLKFGYFADSRFKQRLKRLIGYKKRSFEISSYGMAEFLIDNSVIDKDQAVCIFPGGQGATSIDGLSKGTPPYEKFMSEIRHACSKAKRMGILFKVPAVCWMQGETDITNGKGAAYREKLLSLRSDMSHDIMKITGQKEEVCFICYQSNCLTLSKSYTANSYLLHETEVPQAQMEIVSSEDCFIPSGPVYAYDYTADNIHLNGVSQKQFGALQALAAKRLLNGEGRGNALIPKSVEIQSDSIIKIVCNVPVPPLVFDTLLINKAENYGFSVVKSDNSNILKDIRIVKDTLVLSCSGNVHESKLRYAVNGDKMKSGRVNGPRGNLRDSQGDKYFIMIKDEKCQLHNWCWQFSILVK